ncbi:MAG: NUDIX domain-containing protein [bacterium]|nr:NUDIX domain-containing protein [bacterium]
MFAVGACAVILDAAGRVLLCHRRDMDVWNLPGGALEAGELPTEAAVRETIEETGLDVAVDRLIGVYGKTRKNELVFAFLCRIVGGQLRETDEADSLRFFDPDHLPRHISPKQVERIQDAMHGGSRPVFRKQSQPETRELVRQWQDEAR